MRPLCDIRVTPHDIRATPRDIRVTPRDIRATFCDIPMTLLRPPVINPQTCHEQCEGLWGCQPRTVSRGAGEQGAWNGLYWWALGRVSSQTGQARCERDVPIALARVRVGIRDSVRRHPAVRPAVSSVPLVASQQHALGTQGVSGSSLGPVRTIYGPSRARTPSARLSRRAPAPSAPS